MAWKITKNYLDPGDTDIQSHQYVSDAELTVKFKLYDDDGNCYFEGLMYASDQTEEEAFAPLNWAMGYAGCTYMKIQEEGKWNIL